MTIRLQDLLTKKPLARLFKLSRQVSNLNSSDPESDVLPITLRDNFEVANINYILKNCNRRINVAGYLLLVAGYLLLVAGYLLLVVTIFLTILNLLCYAAELIVLKRNMSSYNDLEIYQLAFEFAKKVHFATLKLPAYELYEQGSQIRRSSKSIKDQIAEGYGRRRYKTDFIKFLIYAISSFNETISQLKMLIEIYPDIADYKDMLPEYENLGKKINSFIQYVESNWRT